MSAAKKECSASSESIQAAGSSATEGGLRPRSLQEEWFRDGSWLCITLKEARNLGAFDMSTQSSDTFAKMKLTLPGERGSIIAEHRTRTLHRNLFPMFEERLLCPLASLKPACMFELRLYDADWLRNEFMGQVKLSVAQVLQSLEVASGSSLQWITLTAKHAQRRIKSEGEVLLEAKVLTMEQAKEAQSARDHFKQEELATRFKESSLKLSLHAINFLDTFRAAAVAHIAQNLAVEVRVGQSMAMHNIKPRAATGAKGESPLELELEDTVDVPLASAFNPCVFSWPGSLQSKANSEMQDVKIYLHSENVVLSKTQVPLWSIPTCGSNANFSQLSSEPSADNLVRAPSSKGSNKYSDTGSLLSKEVGKSDDSPQPFVRTMEPLARKSPFAACTLDFSLIMIQKSEMPSLSRPSSQHDDEKEVYQLDMLEEQEDARDAPPLRDLPEPLGTHCLELYFDFGPCRLYQLLLKTGSKIAARVAAEEGLKNYVRGEWEMVDTNEGQFRQRKCTYRKPVSVPVPFAPKFADMVEIHTLKIKEISGWVGEVVSRMENGPMADAFQVVLQVVGIRGATSGSSVLRVSMKVEFIKNPGLLKQVIEAQTKKEAMAHWMLMGKVIKGTLAEENGCQESDNADSKPASLTAQSSSLTCTAPIALPPPPAVGVRTWLIGLLFFGLLLLVVLVVSLQQHAHAIRMLSESVKLLAMAHQQQH